MNKKSKTNTDSESKQSPFSFFLLPQPFFFNFDIKNKFLGRITNKDHQIKKNKENDAFLFVGPPLSGKGTQSKILKEKLNLVHVNIGNALRSKRKEDSELGIYYFYYDLLFLLFFIIFIMIYYYL